MMNHRTFHQSLAVISAAPAFAIPHSPRMRTLLILSLLTTTLSAEPLPVLLKKDFSNGSDRWQPTDPTKWKIKEVDGNKVFELVEGNSDYKPPFRSPSQCHLQSPTPG